MKNILKSNSKLLYGIVVLSIMLLSISYGIFVITSSDYKSSELLVGNLLYGISIHDTDKQTLSNPVTVGTGETILYVTISSVNSISSKYTLAYDNNNITVSASNKSGWNASGSMTTYNNYAYSKTVKVVVSNNSSSNQSVTFAAFGGYSYNSASNIPLGNGYYSVANFTDVTSTTGKLLTTIVEEDTNCNSANCLYGGEATTNYFTFEEDGDLYRILGTYTLDNEKTTKIAANTLTEVASSNNLSTSLNTIKSSLDTEHIYSTNKFNCQGTNSLTCTSSNYSDIGILSLDEYKQLEGDNSNSYLYNSNSYYLLDNTTLVSNTNQSEMAISARIRPTMYLDSDAKVTGSGTIDNPYVLEDEADVNIIAYTLNNVDVTNSMSYNDLYNGNYIINSVTCTKGNAILGNDANSVIFTNVPASCTINFIERYTITSKMAMDSSGPRTNFNILGDPVGIYETTSTEDGSKVYYYSNLVNNNWVIFGRCTDSSYNCIVGDYLYWRIIRTNTILEGKGIRLLYSGSGPYGTIINERNLGVACDTTTTSNCVGKAYITTGNFNDQNPNGTTVYVGYKYGTEGSLASNRANTYDSTIKSVVDTWYESQSLAFKSRVNTSAIYCNDRAHNGEYVTSGGAYINYGALVRRRHPSLICGGVGEGNSGTYIQNSSGQFTNSSADKFTGLGAALITADELAYGGALSCWYSCPAGPMFASYASNGIDAAMADSGLGDGFWTMSPSTRYMGYGSHVFLYDTINKSTLSDGGLGARYVNWGGAVRPVVSVLESYLYIDNGADGTPSNPYIISID